MGRMNVGLVLLWLSLASCGGQPPAKQAADTQDRIPAQPPAILPGTGWIEGTITDTNGTPPVVGGSLGVPLVLKTDGGDVKSQSGPSSGGFYTFRDLKPGSYELFIEGAHLPTSDQPLRPIHVSGIAVEAGKRTLLNLRMHPGQELEETGKPAVTLQKFVVISDELERLQAQIDELKKR